MSDWKTDRIKLDAGAAQWGSALAQATSDPEPELARALRLEGDRLRLAGDFKGWASAHLRALRATAMSPDLAAVTDALLEGRPQLADGLLADVLRRRPEDVLALRLRAEVALRAGRHAEAEAPLAQCLRLAPDYLSARAAYGLVLFWLGRAEQAVGQADILVAQEPRNLLHRQLRAGAEMRIGAFAEAAWDYEAILAETPEPPLVWMAYGHALRALGRQADAVSAYRRALASEPRLGEAWWSLANLKTVAFTPDDVAAMTALHAMREISAQDQLHLSFALGKAHEDAGRYAEAFAAYKAGAAARRRGLAYDAAEIGTHLARSAALMTPAFFKDRQGGGTPAADAIFIVGLPRSGSTLVEQILASHSLVEGTQELPDITAIAARLAGRSARSSEGAYPDILAALAPEELRALGDAYLRGARVHRRLGRPFFIDKTPNNFAHLGLIHLILPNAKIVDVRRHPMACCFSAFKQLFAEGQAFSYQLDELGRYYADYVSLMAHFDAVLPGRVYRVIYEALVADPDAQIRALLDACGLPFETACLAPHETSRPIRTASSEQVRRPITADSVDHWRHFEPWLQPLKTALGPVLDAYPHAPLHRAETAQ